MSLPKSSSSSQPMDFQVKDSDSKIAGGRFAPGGKPSTFDLVEKMEYLFVRVVKARDLPAMDITGSLDPYVVVRHGNIKGTTKHFEKNQHPEWNQVFTIPRGLLQLATLDVELKDKDLVVDDFVGRVTIDVNEVPLRVPPDSPLAPEWYRLEDKKGDKLHKGELMLAVWFGTQADEAFHLATHFDGGTAAPEAVDARTLSAYTRPKVYHAPRMWYVRVNIIEAQDVVAAAVSDKGRVPEVFCKATVGRQMRMTKVVKSRASVLRWNEEFIFVAAEPFEESLILSVEDRVSPSKDEVVGRVEIRLGSVETRLDQRNVRPKWLELRRPVLIDVDRLKEDKFSSKLQARIILDGGYHVGYERVYYSSDLRPSAKQLWKKPIGLLELGILRADGLQPSKKREQGKGTCDAYCVAKYGRKWVRTKTAVDELSPRFNEQYSWDVHDHATVLTVGVFDNNQLLGGGGIKDANIGKVRIRLSTLEAERVYANSYPLLVLQSSGVKKMGELHLAVRFSSASTANTMLMYTKPLLPKMHYSHPLPLQEQEMLRRSAVDVMVERLGRMEPPLRREVVLDMVDARPHLWSMRRTKANLQRIFTVFSGAIAVATWFQGVCLWKNPAVTVLVHILFFIRICCPSIIFPLLFLYELVRMFQSYWFRPRKPPHMNVKISLVEQVNVDELEEEFDQHQTSRSPETIRMRYERLRSVALGLQKIMGDVATQGERLQLLLSWRDPRATALFMAFCLVAALVFYITPLRVVALLTGFYLMRHPKFRGKMPSPGANFFRRLPARTDNLL